MQENILELLKGRCGCVQLLRESISRPQSSSRRCSSTAQSRQRSSLSYSKCWSSKGRLTKIQGSLGGTARRLLIWSQTAIPVIRSRLLKCPSQNENLAFEEFRGKTYHILVIPGYQPWPIRRISAVNLLLVISALLPVACIVCIGVRVSGVKKGFINKAM